MKGKSFVAALFCAGLVGLAGCRTAPIYNATDVAIATPLGRQALTLDQVGAVIVSAGSSLGWAVQIVKPGDAMATLHLRGHTAVVEIPYSTTTFSIIYKSSDNLNYDASRNYIHSNYNGWVTNLRSAIQRIAANAPTAVSTATGPSQPQ